MCVCVLGPAGWALVLGYSRHGVVFALSDCLRSIKRERGGGEKVRGMMKEMEWMRREEMTKH